MDVHPVLEPVGEEQSQAECEALRKNFCQIVDVVSQGKIPSALYENGIIDDDLILQGHLTSSEYGKKLMQQVLKSVKRNPKKYFEAFCRALDIEMAGKEVLTNLRSMIHQSPTHLLLQQKAQVDSTDTSEERARYREIKFQLELLCKTFQSSSSSEAKESAITLIKDQMQMFIENSLSAGLDNAKVKSEIDALCYKEPVVPSILLEWVNEEFEEQSIKQAQMSARQVSQFVKVPANNDGLSLFNKDTLYHAGLCCEAVSTCMTEDEIGVFFNTKSPMHNFEEVSLSKNVCVQPYLITKQGNKIYVAFKGSTFIAEYDRIGYDEAMRSQASHVPVRFFTELLWNHYKVILTGFSFGGLLACCVMANLWQESRISAEVLLKQTTCIVFGTPFMKIQMIDRVLRIAPDLRKCIHSVFLKEDLFPQIMGYVSLAGSTPNQDRAKLPRVQESEEARQSDASSMLARTRRIKVMTESLVNLQRAHLQKQKAYSKMASPAPRSGTNFRKDLNNLKEEVEAASESTPEEIVTFVYGKSYVIGESKSQFEWQECSHNTPQILSLHLTFNTKVLSKKIEGLQDQSLFKKHDMKYYNLMVLRSYLDRPERYSLPSNQLSGLQQMMMLQPSLKRAELHEYPKEQVLVLEGENLWFSFKIVLDEGGTNEYIISHPHNATKLSLQFNFSTSRNVSTAIKDEGKVKITLHTHFMTKVMDSVECKKKSYSLSVRQMQLAKHTPSQVIKLAYLSTLLEQQQSESHSTTRNLKTICFLEEAVKVVPVESVLDAIAYARHDIAIDCAKALKASKLTLQPTELMITGLLESLIRGIHGVSREVIEDLMSDHNPDQTPSLLFSMGTFGPVPGFPFDPPSPATHNLNSTTHNSSTVHSPGSDDILPHSADDSASLPAALVPPAVGTSASPLYTDVVSGKFSSDVQSTLTPPNDSALQLRSHSLMLPHFFAQMNFFLALDPRSYPETIFFPEEITTFLQSSIEGLFERAQTLGQNIEVVGKTNLDEIYPASTTRRRNMTFVSPRTVLAQSITKLNKAIHETQMEVNFANPKATRGNKKMLKLINSIYNNDVALCAALLGAFMERCIEIPLLESPEVTAKAVSSPMAVGVWALFSVSRNNLQQMLESSKNTELVVKVREYMHSVLSDKSHDRQETEESVYAGKLQFLLHGMHKTVTSSTKCISYSLEYQLCNNLKFRKDISVQELISDWDRIFKDDVLYHVAKSHRPLLARWLRWTILVHDLRETLAEYTCIGVTGLINSGKSLLVKKLFNLKKVQVGTLKSKQTTVPLLYNINVDCLDVIDFPGMDDTDESVPDLAQLMLTLSQIIVFVVDYRRISASAIKLWLKKMKSDDVPVLVCLTHADNLYLECEREHKMESLEDKRRVIQNELQNYREVIGNSLSWTVEFYSFAPVPSTTRREELEAVGIKSHVDVGKWLVDILKNKLDQCDLAEKLETFFRVRDSSCSSQ